MRILAVCVPTTVRKWMFYPLVLWSRLASFVRRHGLILQQVRMLLDFGRCSPIFLFVVSFCGCNGLIILLLYVIICLKVVHNSFNLSDFNCTVYVSIQPMFNYCAPLANDWQVSLVVGDSGKLVKAQQESSRRCFDKVTFRKRYVRYSKNWD